MAKLPKEPSDNEYGRRYYVGRQNFDEQQRLTTDKHVDNLGHIPHSETKKPYDPDLDYPEMEHFRFDLGEWPVFPIPEFPPVIEDLPDVPGEGFRIEYNQTIPCEFIRELSPYILQPGDFGRARLDISENPVVDIKVSGPIRIVSDLQQIFQCTDKRLSPDTEQITTGCEVVVQADAKVEGSFDGEFIPVDIVATNKTGRTCQTKGLVQAGCPEVLPELSYDWDASEHYVNQDDSAVIAVSGGVPPYTWQMSQPDSHGFSLSQVKTNSRFNQVFLNSDGCGGAFFTVTDACEQVCHGSIRYDITAYINTSWQSYSSVITSSPYPDDIPGDHPLIPADESECPFQGDAWGGSSWVFVDGSGARVAAPRGAVVWEEYFRNYDLQIQACDATRNATCTGGCNTSPCDYYLGCWTLSCYPQAFVLWGPDNRYYNQSYNCLSFAASPPDGPQCCDSGGGSWCFCVVYARLRRWRCV